MLNFHGIEKFLRQEYQNELTHGLGIGDYLTKRGNDISRSIMTVQYEVATDTQAQEDIAKWDKPMDIFKYLYNFEVKNQDALNELSQLCLNENDHGTYNKNYKPSN